MADNKTLDFSAFIADRTKDFTGREWVFAAIDDWLADPNGPTFFIITGAPGVGKSAIAARLTQTADLSAYHFCIAREAKTIDPALFARSLSHQLCRIDDFALGILKDSNIDLKTTQNVQANYGQVIGANIEHLVLNTPSGSVAFTHAVMEPLEALCRKGYDQQVVALIDALDEAMQQKGSETIVDLLTNMGNLPGQVRFVLTSRPEGAALRYFEERHIPYFRLDADRPENLEDIRRYTLAQLAASEAMSSRLIEQHMHPEDFINRITAASQGNFLYVVWLLPAIAAGTQRFDALEALPQGLDGIYREFLHTRGVRPDKESWRTLYRPILGALVVAQAPLTAAQLRQFSELSAQAVGDGLLDLHQFLDPASADKDRYLLYHQSINDWLQDKERSQEFWIDTSLVHGCIVSFYRAGAGSWAVVDWHQVDDYGLRYLAEHIYPRNQKKSQLSDDGQGGFANELHQLLLESRFGSTAIERFRSPLPFLDDLRLGLTVALERNDMVQIWRYVDRYRKVFQNERRPDRVVADTQAGNFEAALDRTALFGTMPNSQGMLRLLIAWHAAAAKQTEIATRAAILALGTLPSRGFVSSATKETDPMAAPYIQDAVSTALQRLLIRVSWEISESRNGQDAWLRKITANWPSQEIKGIAPLLDEHPTKWGSQFNEKHESSEAIVAQLRTSYENDPYTVREVTWVFQHRLAAALYQERKSPTWQLRIDNVVNTMSFDDYPSYREMALAWIAAAAVCHEDAIQARQALGTVLLGALDMSEPGFGDETIVAILQGLAWETHQGLRTDGLANNLRDHPAVGTTNHPTPKAERKKAGMRSDPWAFELLRLNAISEMLYRQGKLDEAETILDGAGRLSSKGSYAGYRVLARLALACRWLEWGKPERVAPLVQSARQDAIHMVDPTLGHERANLVDTFEKWLAELRDHALELVDADIALRRTGDLTGMMRSLRIQFLAALWSAQPERLKLLVPLALTDITAMDAVLGRLFAQWGKVVQADRPFERLAHEMGIEHLERQFIVGE